MIRRPPRSTQSRSSAASDVYKRQNHDKISDPSSHSIFSLKDKVSRRSVETTSKSGQILQRSEMTRCAKSGLMHGSKQHPYSITSSAVVSRVGGTVMPSVCAVLRLITSSYLVGAPTNGLRVDIFVGY